MARRVSPPVAWKQRDPQRRLFEYGASLPDAPPKRGQPTTVHVPCRPRGSWRVSPRPVPLRRSRCRAPRRRWRDLARAPAPSRGHRGPRTASPAVVAASLPTPLAFRCGAPRPSPSEGRSRPDPRWSRREKCALAALRRGARTAKRPFTRDCASSGSIGLYRVSPRRAPLHCRAGLQVKHVLTAVPHL